MEQLKPFSELVDAGTDFEFEAQILEKNGKERDLLIKKGYKIKKPIWNGLIAS